MQPTYYSLKQIAAILHSKSNKINLHLEKVQNRIDAIADLCHGNDPATRIKGYPVTKQPAVKKELNIYCQCRLPLASEHLKR